MSGTIKVLALVLAMVLVSMSAVMFKRYMEEKVSYAAQRHQQQLNNL